MAIRKPVIIVQGAQWGSESKGTIAAQLCIERDINYAIRTGAINAGHTVIYKGRTVKNQQLPTGWVNPDTRLIIGAGAYIHPGVLQKEIDEINSLMPEFGDVRDRLFIDRRVGVHLEEHEGAASAANRHHRIGATGKGCSETIVDKIRNRNNGYKLFAQTQFTKELNVSTCDTVKMLNDAVDEGQQLLIEGTQGTLLDLHLGPYPFTTSRMTSAANWIAEAGLAPTLEYEVVLVARTYPIRVAGNSGPMDGEIDWSDLAREMNMKLEASGMEPIVSESALNRWRDALQQAAVKAMETRYYQVPREGRQMLTDVGHWDAATRDKFRVAASELHRDAMNLLDGDTVSELCRLFEMTTVTKKLRRIARFSFTDIEYAIRINRPSWIALTFLNYEFPQLNRWTPVQPIDPHILRSAYSYVANMESAVGVPIKMMSTGPLLHHVLDTQVLDPRTIQHADGVV